MDNEVQKRGSEKYIKNAFDMGYNAHKRDVLELIDEKLKITKQLYKDDFLTRQEFKSIVRILKELESEITGEKLK